MFRFKRRGRSQKRENQLYNQRNRNHKLKSVIWKQETSEV